MTSFDVLQNILTKFFYLIHSNTKKQLFLDFDVNKKFDFDVILYYVKKIFHKNDDKYFSRHVIESIFFLSRFIINAKSKYWFIELKIIEIIWVLKKTRYIVETIFDIIIIYINYDVAIDIAKQATLIIIFMNKLNFRLMRAFDYIQRFNLNIKYKLEKQHIISNVLFKFVNNNTNSLVKNIDENEFDVLFTIFLIEINSKFKQYIVNEYKSNLNWQRICYFLKFNDNENVIKLFFYIKKTS